LSLLELKQELSVTPGTQTGTSCYSWNSNRNYQLRLEKPEFPVIIEPSDYKCVLVVAYCEENT